MNKQVTIPFQVTGWDATPYDETPGSPTLSRVDVKKIFDGELKGESAARLLMRASEDGSAGYTVMERVEGCLCGRAGSFVMISRRDAHAAGNQPRSRIHYAEFRHGRA